MIPATVGSGAAVSKTVAEAVSAFGKAAKAKLSNIAATGQPEDQLRAPLEALVRGLAEIGGLPAVERILNLATVLRSCQAACNLSN